MAHQNEVTEIVAHYSAALNMVRDAIEELFGPLANLESEEAVLLRGPDPYHRAEAMIAALQNVSRHISVSDQTRP